MFLVFQRVFGLFALISVAGAALPALAEMTIMSNGVRLRIQLPSSQKPNVPAHILVDADNATARTFFRLNLVMGSVDRLKVPTLPNSFGNLIAESAKKPSTYTLVHAEQSLYAVDSRDRWVKVTDLDEKIISWGIHRLDLGSERIAEVVFLKTELDRENGEIQIFVLPNFRGELFKMDILKSWAMPYGDGFRFERGKNSFGWIDPKSKTDFFVKAPSDASNWHEPWKEVDPRNLRTVVPIKPVTNVGNQQKQAHLPALIVPVDRGPKDLFENETEIDRISKFEEEYNQIVIGQSKVAKRLAAALFAHAGNPVLSGKPFSVILVGPKRTGKTMTGKALAKILHGSEKKSVTISLGNIQTEAELRNVFNSPKSFIGSDKPGQLELAVLQLMDGDSVARGVIVLDEFSDMGGGGSGARKMKEALLKAFYELITEGRLYSTAKSEFIDVTQIKFILTGNDGAYLFDGAPSESAKQKRHDENSDRIQVEKMLESSGVPGPLLKRLDDVILVEPMSREKARRIVSEILLPEFKKGYLEKYNVKIEFGPSESEFINVLVTDYFGSDDGVAGIRDLVHMRIGSLVSRVLIENRKELKEISNRSVKLEWKSVTQLNATVGLADRSANYEEDFGALRTPRPLLVSDVEDPFDDPRLAEKIEGLPGQLKERVFGQDEVLDALAKMVRAKAYDPSGEPSVQAVLIVGTTGSGKTETAKALAESTYGKTEASKHLVILPMGEYHSEADFNRLVGVAPGYVDSDRESDLENAIRKLQSVGGGYLVLDEVSNVGGGKPEVKNAFFKLLYNMKEEKKWTSTRTNITYDLSSIFIVMTGNDAEEFFQGAFAYSDEMRQSIWEEHAPREKLEAELVKRGFPPAFLGRLDGVFLQRPQGLSALEKIAAKKFLEPAIQVYEKNQPGIKIEYDARFLTQFTETFFAHGRGARSLRSVVDQYLKTLVTDAILHARSQGVKKGEAYKLKLSLSDNWDGLIYRDANTPEKRVVQLNGLVILEKGERKFQTDVSAVTPEKPLYDYAAAEATAYHEAGHAVSNIPDLTGERVKHITIRGGGSIMGYASYERIPGKDAHTRRAVIAKIASLMSGQLGEMMSGFEKNAGWSIDLERIRKLANSFLVNWGLIPELVGLNVDENGNIKSASPNIMKVHAREYRRLLMEAFSLAQDRLTEKWAQVEAVKEQLMRDGVVTKKQFNEIMANSSDARIKPNREPVLVTVDMLIGKPKLPKKPCVGFLTQDH